jgi:hypothetical protein
VPEVADGGTNGASIPIDHGDGEPAIESRAGVRQPRDTRPNNQNIGFGKYRGAHDRQLCRSATGPCKPTNGLLHDVHHAFVFL